MLKTLLTHELLNLLKSRRVYWTVIMFILLFASVFTVRVIDYQKQLNQYIDDVRLNEEALQTAKNYSYIKPRAIQQPILFSIYNTGFKISRVIDIQFYEPIVIAKSLNEESNMFSIANSRLDITFLVTFFLSLFILLISYDSVNGEKQVGTLRLLMTFPLKRQSFILKKMLGTFIFVAITFSLPYLISLLCLMLIYANLLTINFILSAFFYWFLVMLFILFFTLLGIFISCCTISPNRSLVYSLLVWILFAMVLPLSWDYILEPAIYNNKINQLQQIYNDKWVQLNDVRDSPPADANPNGGTFLQMNGEGFYNSLVWSDAETHQRRYRYQRYMYHTYFPQARVTEFARDNAIRNQIAIGNTKNWVFFFDPIVLFENLAMKISGNSREDFLKLLHNARELRDEIVEVGVAEGWLFDYRFNAYTADPNHYELDFEELLMQYNGDVEAFYGYLYDLYLNAPLFELTMPSFRRFNQPIYTLGEIFSRIFPYLVMFVGAILALWLMTWARFMKYDVR